ncbi:MAG TPA: hypothetical protein VFN94_00975 [Nitrospiria bacterium]|nr:hypothetical protein [Nitrospiria bacterium]
MRTVIFVGLIGLSVIHPALGVPAMAAGALQDAVAPSRSGGTGEVTTKRDQFTGKTAVVLRSMDLGGHVSLFALTSPNGDHVSVSLVVLGQTSEFRGCHPISWKINGQLQSGPPTQHDSQVTDRGVTETIKQEIPVALFRRLSAAQTLMVRLCTRDIEVTGEQVGMLKKFGEAAGIKYR